MSSFKAPVRKLLKRDVIWLSEHFCRHGHTYLEHYSCFLQEKPDTSPMNEKIGIFDIETTGIMANWSHMLSWCIKEHNTSIIHYDLVTSREARDGNDKRIVKSAIKELAKYDRIVTFYGTRFDIPYTRSRALGQGLEFPSYKDLYHTDLYYVVRMKFRLHSNRLGSVCEFLGIEAKSHRMTPQLNRDAKAGRKEALGIVLLHNKEDVRSTDDVFNVSLDHMMVNKRSI